MNGYLTESGEMRTTLPFDHTASGLPDFLCRFTTSRTASFRARSALSCKDNLFFMRYLAPLFISWNNSLWISSERPFFSFAMRIGFAPELSKRIQELNRGLYRTKKFRRPRAKRRFTSWGGTSCPPSATLSLIRDIANSELGIQNKNKLIINKA